MREGRWKLMSSEGRDQLFDLETDKTESNDVSEFHPGRVVAMKTALAKWSEEVHRQATPQPMEKDQ